MEPKYEDLRSDVKNQLFSIKPDDIVLFEPKKDDLLPTNYTLNIFPNKRILDQLTKTIEKLRKIDPKIFGGGIDCIYFIDSCICQVFHPRPYY